MAQKVAAATGAWSAAATWNSVTNTPTLHASTNITISTSNLFTATFTAPNTTNACTGVLLFIPAVGSGGTVTVTLQESTIDTAAAQAIAVTALVAGTWVYFRFATPYVFTTIVAGSYRFKIVNAGAAGTTSAAADSGAANIAYLATDDRTGVPGTTDDIWVCGQNQATAITVTMDGTQTIGSGAVAGVGLQRSIQQAIHINNLGVLAWDTTADGTLTCKGNVVCNNNSGELQIGTTGTPMPAARLAKLRFDENGVAGNYGITIFSTGKLTLQGTPKSSTTLWKAKLSSGVGTAANPAIMDTAVDWSVGDEVLIGSTDTYDHTEYRFIITKNSATSYVWSSTSGGAEAALTHTHTSSAWVLNIQRNVFIDSTNVLHGFYILCSTTIGGNVDVDWARFDIIGAALASRVGVSITTASTPSTGSPFAYTVISRCHDGMNISGRSDVWTFTGIIICNSTGTGTGGFIPNLLNNTTFIDCFVVDFKRSGTYILQSFNIRYTRCFFISCNKDAASFAGITFDSSAFCFFNDCEVQCCRQNGIVLNRANDTIFTNLLSGTKGTNTIDVIVTQNTFNTLVFVNSTFGSATLVQNYLLQTPGSSIQFQAYNGISTNHIWYTNTGTTRSTGAGLVDTTIKTAGSLGLRIAPENLTVGFVWEFLIGINANSAASIFGFVDANAAFEGAFGATFKAELFLPGSTVADDSVTIPTDEPWTVDPFGNVFTLGANYTGTVASFATIRITVKTTTAAAYVYLDSFYNGTNVLTALDAWYNGKPTPVMTDLLGDPAAVWTQLTSTFTTAGTVGKLVADNLDASIADVEADTQDIQARLPAALTGDGNIKADTLMIEGVDATNQIRDSILADATRFAGADIATIKGYIDTEIASILAAVDTEVAAIKTKTDNLPTDPADESNIQTSITAVLTAIAALNNPSTAAIVTAIFAGAMEGRAFEEIIKDIWAQVVGDFEADDDEEPTEIDYDGPNGIVQLTHQLTDTTRVRV